VDGEIGKMRIDIICSVHQALGLSDQGEWHGCNM